MNNHCKPWKLRWEETRMKPLRDCALNRENCFFTAVALSANSKRQGRAAEALMSKHQCQREQTKIVDNPRDSTTVRFYDVVLEVARWTTPHGTRVICVNECFHFKRWLGPGWFIYIYIFSFPGVDGVPDVQHKDVSHKSSTDEEVGLFLCSR